MAVYLIAASKTVSSARKLLMLSTGVDVASVSLFISTNSSLWLSACIDKWVSSLMTSKITLDLIFIIYSSCMLSANGDIISRFTADISSVKCWVIEAYMPTWLVLQGNCMNHYLMPLTCHEMHVVFTPMKDKILLIIYNYAYVCLRFDDNIFNSLWFMWSTGSTVVKILEPQKYWTSRENVYVILGVCYTSAGVFQFQHLIGQYS